MTLTNPSGAAMRNVKSEISQQTAPPARSIPIVELERSSRSVLSTTARRIASRIGYDAQTLRTNNGTLVSLMLAEIQNCHRMSTCDEGDHRHVDQTVEVAAGAAVAAAQQLEHAEANCEVRRDPRRVGDRHVGNGVLDCDVGLVQDVTQRRCADPDRQPEPARCAAAADAEPGDRTGTDRDRQVRDLSHPAVGLQHADDAQHHNDHGAHAARRHLDRAGRI